MYLRAATLVDEARKIPAYDPLADGRFTGCPNGRRLWPFWLVWAATGNVRDAKGRRLYPGEDRWIGLVVSKARPIGEPDDGVDPGVPDGGTPDLPDATDLLEVIADTAGELEDHIAAMSVSLETLRHRRRTCLAQERLVATGRNTARPGSTQGRAVPTTLHS